MQEPTETDYARLMELQVGQEVYFRPEVRSFPTWYAVLALTEGGGVILGRVQGGKLFDTHLLRREDSCRVRDVRVQAPSGH